MLIIKWRNINTTTNTKLTHKISCGTEFIRVLKQRTQTQKLLNGNYSDVYETNHVRLKHQHRDDI